MKLKDLHFCCSFFERVFFLTYKFSMDYQSEVRKNFFKKISEETKETTLESLDFEL